MVSNSKNCSTYLENRNREKGIDVTQHIFLGYITTFATFSLRRQVAVKLKIVKIIKEKELSTLRKWQEAPIQHTLANNRKGMQTVRLPRVHTITKLQ